MPQQEINIAHNTGLPVTSGLDQGLDARMRYKFDIDAQGQGNYHIWVLYPFRSSRQEAQALQDKIVQVAQALQHVLPSMATTMLGEIQTEAFEVHVVGDLLKEHHLELHELLKRS